MRCLACWCHVIDNSGQNFQAYLFPDSDRVFDFGHSVELL